MPTTPAEFERQLRSLFAVLRTLVRQTAAGRESVEDYAAHLEGRIGCLARSHAMVLRAPEEGVDLHEIVASELLTQAAPENRYAVQGKEVRIGRESAAAIALSIHELAMNALTHGALANEHGTVGISWRITGADDSRVLILQWSERDAALTDLSPGHKGFGSELLERMLPYELSAQSTVEYTSNGLQVELQVPERAESTIWRASARR